MRRLQPVDTMLLTTVVLWSLNFTVTKYVLSHGFRPLSYASLRYTAAALLFAGITYLRERSFRVRSRDLWLLLAPSAVLLLVNQFSFAYAVRLTTASTVALVFGTVPIFVALLARAVGFERLSRAFWLAVALSFAGVGLVAAGSGGVAGDVKGDLLALLATSTWAAYSVALVPLMRRYSAWRISSIVLLGTAAALLVSAIPQLSKQDFAFRAGVWLGFSYAVVTLVVTSVLWYTAIDRVGPSRSALFANLQPFLGAVFALVLLSEHLSLLEGVGGVAILVGILIERRARVAVVAQAPAD
jgi:drug/metabolite transporter (DMT)-like permease